MTKVEIFTGFDVSKDQLDFCTLGGAEKSGSGKVAFNAQGLKSLLRKIPSGSHCVMEATGPYHVKLATWLFKNGYAVSVVNPLVIKHFSRMNLRRAKTDKADARIIASYGQREKPALWEPPAAYMVKLQQLEALLDLQIKHHTAQKNQLHSIEATGKADPFVRNQLKKLIEYTKKIIQKQEDEILKVIDNEHKAMLKNLTSIPGIGKKTAVALIVATGGFTRFDSHKKLISYLGLCPRIFESGSSVRGRSRICKLGMVRIRKFLYMCTWSAIKANEACKEMYERLVENGKPKMVALIAVANKLVRMAFAIAKSGEKYQPV
jgi:transposase